ncbi:Ger(x)C family spore germination protein [Bacillus carboniphilus]|uniref:Ger(X)C family spore germination protein n=1 Tax=Bacillus carboniphilus TaxID=86663 RepID=A0ABN0W6V8_9BACI
MTLLSKKTSKAMIMLFFLSLLSGCVEKETVDDINIVSGLGYDLEDGGDLKGTVVFPVYSPDAEVENVTISATSDISRRIVLEMQRKSANKLALGSLEVVLYSDELAKEKGVTEIVDSLQRDPSIGSRLFLAIAEGKASEILESNLGKSGTGRYLADLLEHNMEQRDVPTSNLHRFNFQYYDQGMTSYLPILKKFGKEDIKITGIAFFKEGKMVHKIPAEDMYYFKLLSDKYSKGTVAEKEDGEESAVKIIDSKHNFDVIKTNGEVSKIIVNIEVDAIALEYTGRKLTEVEIRKIEKKLEDSIRKKCTDMIDEFKEKKIDPVGFGKVAKSKSYNFDYKKWEDHYPGVEIEIKPTVTIKEVGIVE